MYYTRSRKESLKIAKELGLSNVAKYFDSLTDQDYDNILANLGELDFAQRAIVNPDKTPVETSQTEAVAPNKIVALTNKETGLPMYFITSSAEDSSYYLSYEDQPETKTELKKFRNTKTGKIEEKRITSLVPGDTVNVVVGNKSTTQPKSTANKKKALFDDNGNFVEDKSGDNTTTDQDFVSSRLSPKAQAALAAAQQSNKTVNKKVDNQTKKEADNAAKTCKTRSSKLKGASTASKKQNPFK